MKTKATKQKYTPITDAEIKRITKETAERDEKEPRLSEVEFREEAPSLLLHFKKGATLEVPLSLLGGFEGASAEQMRAAKIVSNGAAIHWDELDVQMTTIAIIQRVFNVKTTIESARKAGSVKSEAKRAASSANGKLGGRPRKTTGLVAA